MTAARFMRWGAPLAIALLFSPALAHADPVITPIVTALVAAGVNTAVATFVVTATVNLATSFAIPFSRRRLSGKGRGK